MMVVLVDLGLFVWLWVMVVVGFEQIKKKQSTYSSTGMISSNYFVFLHHSALGLNSGKECLISFA